MKKKKLFGSFVVGTSILAIVVASFTSESPIVEPPTDKLSSITEADLEGIFGNVFNDPGFMDADNLLNGTYEYKINEKTETFNGYDTISIGGSIIKNENQMSLEYIQTNTNNYFYTDTTVTVEDNMESVVVKSTNGIVEDVFMRYKYDKYEVELNSEADPIYIYSNRTFDQIASEYSYLYPDLHASEISQYDYLRFKAGDDMLISGITFKDFSCMYSDMSLANMDMYLELLNGYKYILGDFIIKDYATYELVNQFEAYVLIDFPLFNSKLFDIVYEAAKIYSNVNGDLLSKVDFRLEWERNIKTLVNKGIEAENVTFPIKLGINPSSEKIMHISFDLEPIYSLFGKIDFYNFEISYANNGITGHKIYNYLDGDNYIKEINYNYLAYDTYRFLLNSGILKRSWKYDEELDEYIEVITVMYPQLNNIVGLTLEECIPRGYVRKSGWLSLLDYDEVVITRDGDNYYFQLKWLDGSDVFMEPVFLDFEGDIESSMRASIDKDNFRFEYLIQ